eukprot:13125784-Ditylum_brightwellii.AAC.1
MSHMMSIDGNDLPTEIPVVTNNTDRKDLTAYFVGFSQVQKDRTWISDDRVLNTLWLDEIVYEGADQGNKYFLTILE